MRNPYDLPKTGLSRYKSRCDFNDPALHYILLACFQSNDCLLLPCDPLHTGFGRQGREKVWVKLPGLESERSQATAGAVKTIKKLYSLKCPEVPSCPVEEEQEVEQEEEV